MDLGIVGKRALVTGASAGIGRAVAHVLAAEGVRVVIAARNLEKLTLVRDEIAATGAEAPAMVTGDLSTAEGVAVVAQSASAQYGGSTSW
jgi:3-oxoacyl-[acyl-carrier protein] reductase